jgi:hypothetical protein
LLGKYSAADGNLVIDTRQPGLEQVQTAMAHVILPSLLYREQRYRLPKQVPRLATSVAKTGRSLAGGSPSH